MPRSLSLRRHLFIVARFMGRRLSLDRDFHFDRADGHTYTPLAHPSKPKLLFVVSPPSGCSPVFSNRMQVLRALRQTHQDKSWWRLSTFVSASLYTSPFQSNSR